MKVLILGGGGQLGRALGSTVPFGFEVRLLGREGCDITSRDQLDEAIGNATPNLVINAAAYTAVDKAESDIETAHLLNAVAPGYVASAARRAGARTIHISTDFVFDGEVARPRAPSDPTGPLSVYGRTKLQGECAVAKADPDSLIVRTAWLYAVTGTNFVNTMLRLMRQRTAVAVVADQVGTPTNASSLAGGIWSFASHRATGIYHYTDAGVASWYDFAVAIAEEAAELGLIASTIRVTPIATKDYPTAARRPAYAVLDKSASWKLLGEAAPHWRASLRANLQELLPNG